MGAAGSRAVKAARCRGEARGTAVGIPKGPPDRSGSAVLPRRSEGWEVGLRGGAVLLQPSCWSHGMDGGVRKGPQCSLRSDPLLCAGHQETHRDPHRDTQIPTETHRDP